MATFPYNINNLLGGRVRVLWALETVAAVTKPTDIFVQESGYAAAAGWNDFGATKEASGYERGIEKSGWDIQQTTGDVLEEVQDTSRSVTVSIAEITPEHLQIIEEAPTIDTIAAVAGSSEYKDIPYGNISDLTLYRIAFVSQRSKQSGIVTESDSTTKRGRFFIGYGHRATISADSVELEQEKGEMSAIPVTFTFFPDAAQTEKEEFGGWFDEQAGTIT